jgi:diguanylate cyclase (GGDEF)-like protein
MLITIVAVTSIFYSSKLVYENRLEETRRLAGQLVQYGADNHAAATSKQRAQMALEHLTLLKNPFFMALGDNGRFTSLAAPLEAPIALLASLPVRQVSDRFDKEQWAILSTPLGGGALLYYGFHRTSIMNELWPIVAKSAVFVTIALVIYVFIILFYVRSRLEEPLDQLLKKRLHALVNTISSGGEDSALNEPIKNLPKNLSQSIESIFNILLGWSRSKRHFEEFMAVSVNESDKQVLAKNLYLTIRDDFFVKSLLILERNHSANRLELVYSSDEGFEVPESMLSDPGSCLVHRTGARVIQSRDRSFCDLCGELGDDEAVLCKPLVAGANQQGICRMVIDRDRINGGLLASDNFENKMHLAEAHLKPYMDFVALSIGSIGLQNAYRNQALTDELTNLYNRRYIVEYFENILNIAKRKESPVTVMMIDIDNFKRFNDEYGHKTGDQVLKLVSAAITANVREGDAVGRYGGEEFIVIFPHTEMDDAHEVAERIREAVASMQWNEYGFNNLPRITISAGLACFPQHGYSHYHLTNAADKALYRAKRDGKNRIVIHSELKERVEDGQ